MGMPLRTKVGPANWKACESSPWIAPIVLSTSAGFRP